MDYEFFMLKAYEMAQKAYEEDEVPIGCIIVFENEIIGSGYNRRNKEKNVLFHAEIIAIDEACKNINDWRLENATLFVTVEPCAMCAGAIIQARISEVVFATENEKFGAGGSVINILDNNIFNHQAKITSGIMKDECQKIMKDYFKKFRKK